MKRKLDIYQYGSQFDPTAPTRYSPTDWIEISISESSPSENSLSIGAPQVSNSSDSASQDAVPKDVLSEAQSADTPVSPDLLDKVFSQLSPIKDRMEAAVSSGVSWDDPVEGYVSSINGLCSWIMRRANISLPPGYSLNDITTFAFYDDGVDIDILDDIYTDLLLCAHTHIPSGYSSIFLDALTESLLSFSFVTICF